MHAGSKFVYVYDDSSDESDGEGANVGGNTKIEKKSRKIDTNVIKIDFKNLQTHNFVSSASPNKCESCSSIFSSSSELSNDHASKLLWTCAYCQNVNSASVLDNTDVRNDMTYYMEKSTQSSHEPQVESDVDVNDTTLICFCIDTSSSMSSNINDQKEDTFSRLNALKEAVMQQIDYLQAHKPNSRISLITFNSKVSHYDPINSAFLDSIASVFKYRGEQTLIKRILVNDKDKIIEIGKNIRKPSPIKETKDGLIRIIKNLKPHGNTALGPALLLGVASCLKFRGSKIILCTDGEANVGLASLFAPFGDISPSVACFYDFVGQFAKDNGISISLLTVGEKSGIAHLGSVVAATNGTVKVVDPIDLGGEFREIIDDKLIAVNMKATFVLPKHFYVRNYGSLKNKSNSCQTFEIGNVTQKQEYGIEFGIKSGVKRNTIGPEVCFQLILNYSDRDGNRICRVYEKSLKTTNNREEAEEHVDLEVITVNAMQQAARMQILGEIELAKTRLVGQERFFGRQERWRSMERHRILASGNQHVQQYLDELDGTSGNVEEQRKKQSDESAAKMFQTLVFDKSKI